MNVEPSEDQRLIADAVARLFQNESTSERVRKAEPGGFDPVLWEEVCKFGLPMMRVPEASGGSGCGLVETVLVAESWGRYLASVPLIETIVANNLLAAIGLAGQATLAAAAQGKRFVLALADAAQTPRQYVPAASVADGIIYLVKDVLYLLPGQWTSESNLGSAPLSSVLLSGGEKLEEGPAALRYHQAARGEWLILMAAAIAAAARQALENAAEYARERIAFGRPIGSYQGLAHPLADAVTNVDGARLLVLRTIEAVENGENDAAGLLSASYWWAGKAGIEAAIIAMRVFGGYGMTLEYDAQLYYRRILTWSLLAGDSEACLEEAGAAFYGDQTFALPSSSGGGIDFAYARPGSPDLSAAQATREFFAEHLTPELRDWALTTQDGYDPKMDRKLAAAGLLYPDWPVELGGRGDNSLATAAMREVYAELNWPCLVNMITDMVGKIIMHFGTEEAKATILPRLATGVAQCCLGYSEPGSGSDIFAAKTTAVRDGDNWIINGQKMFTSQGHLADYCLLIARTGTDKHNGLTVFIVPLNQPGYSLSAIETIGNERTNVTFYSDVKVPDSFRLGEVNAGVKVLAAALIIEQGGSDFFVGPLKHMLHTGEEWARNAAETGSSPINRSRVRARLAAAKTAGVIADVLARRAIWAASVGRAHKSFGPMAKLFGTEAWVRCANELLALTAPASLFPGIQSLTRIEKETRRSVPSTIYAGTSEVHRSLIAESALNLPRSRS